MPSHQSDRGFRTADSILVITETVAQRGHSSDSSVLFDQQDQGSSEGDLLARFILTVTHAGGPFLSIGQPAWPMPSQSSSLESGMSASLSASCLASSELPVKRQKKRSGVVR